LLFVDCWCIGSHWWWSDWISSGCSSCSSFLAVVVVVVVVVVVICRLSVYQRQLVLVWVNFSQLLMWQPMNIRGMI